jgi:hypothetical protein
MKNTQSEWRELVKELLALLDEEAELLRRRSDQFDELYETILHRRSNRMDSLLAEMTTCQHNQADLDAKLAAARTTFARALGLEARQMRLSRLADRLEESDSLAVERRRKLIIAMAEQLKKKHLRTAILLTESARINRMLLEGLMPGAETVTTYAPGRSDPWRTANGLVDTEI